LVEAGRALLLRHAEGQELRAVEASAGSPVHTAAGEDVEECHLLGKPKRMIEGSERDGRADAQPPRASGDVRAHQVHGWTDAEGMEAVLHEAGREEAEAEVASRVDPEGGRSRADPAERPGAREVAEGPGDDALAADEEAETDRGRERRPSAHLHGVVEERVRLVPGP